METIAVRKPYKHNSDLTLFLFLFATGIFLSTFASSRAVDWHDTFVRAGWHVSNPYEINSFINPPWLVLILAPLSRLPYPVSLAINLGLNVGLYGLLSWKKGGNFLSMLLTLTSFPFIVLFFHGTIEWVAALGFLLPPSLGLIFLLLKPQSGIFVAFDWFRNSDRKMELVGFSAFIIYLSILAWGWWPGQLLANASWVESNYEMDKWNLSPFPYLIPIGIVALLYVLVERPKHSELIACVSTICFMPYLAWSSLALPFTLLSSTNRRLSFAIWLIIWSVVIIRSYHGQTVYLW